MPEMDTEAVTLDALERRLLEVARRIAEEGHSPNNARLYNRVKDHDAPSYQSLKRARARLLELGLLPAPGPREEAAHADR